MSGAGATAPRDAWRLAWGTWRAALRDASGGVTLAGLPIPLLDAVVSAWTAAGPQPSRASWDWHAMSGGSTSRRARLLRAEVGRMRAEAERRRAETRRAALRAGLPERPVAPGRDAFPANDVRPRVAA